MKFGTIFFTFACVILIGGLLLTVSVMFESLIQESFGETIVTFEKCKLENGQTMLSEMCENKTKCLNTGLFFKTCEELRDE